MQYRFADLQPILEAAAEMQRAGIALLNRKGATDQDRQVAREMMEEGVFTSQSLRRLITDRG